MTSYKIYLLDSLLKNLRHFVNFCTSGMQVENIYIPHASCVAK